MNKKLKLSIIVVALSLFVFSFLFFFSKYGFEVYATPEQSCIDTCILNTGDPNSGNPGDCNDQCTTVTDTCSNIALNGNGGFFEYDYEPENWCANVEENSSICYSYCIYDNGYLSESDTYCALACDEPTYEGCSLVLDNQYGFDASDWGCTLLNFSLPVGEEPPPEPDVVFSNIDDTLLISNQNTYSLNGNAVWNENISTIQYREFNPSNLENDGWVNCSCTDTSCDSVSEAFTCNITGITEERSYVYELRIGYGSPTTYLTSTKYGKFELARDDDDSLLAWWNFSSSESLTDYTGNGWNGVLNGTVSSTTSALTGSSTVSFNQGSVNNYFYVADFLSNDFFNDPDAELTIEMMVKPDSGLDPETYYDILSKGNIFNVMISNGDNVKAQINDPAYVYGTPSTSATQLQMNDWNKVEFRFSNIDQSIYMSVNEGPAVGAALARKMYTEATTYALNIGSNLTGNSFKGEIDYIKVYSDSDARAPEVTFVDNIDDLDRVTNPNQVFNIVVTDETGVESLEYLFIDHIVGDDLDLEPWVTVVSPTTGSWGDTEITYDIEANALADSRWYLFVRAVDSNGIGHFYIKDGWYTDFNVSSPSTMPYLSFVIEAVDSTPPFIFAHSIIPNPTVDTSPGVRGFVKDYEEIGSGDTHSAIATIEYQISKGVWDGEIWIPEETSAWIDVPALDGRLAYTQLMEEFYFIIEGLEAGVYTLEIRAVDAAGNSTQDNDSNHFETFEVYEVIDKPEPDIVEKTEDFETHTYHDVLFSDGIWGNGILRLKQEIDFNQTTELFTGYSDFGFPFGEAYIGVHESIDGNLWIITNDNRIVYYDVDTANYVKYPEINNLLHRIGNVREFEYDSKRFLLINTTGGDPTIIYDINNTPMDIGDDNYVSYEDKAGFADYKHFDIVDIDTRGDNLVFFATVNNAYVGENFYIRIDTEGTLLDLSDDTYVVWGRDDELFYYGGGVQKLEADFTATYLDQEENIFFAASYSHGVYECRDNGTPTNKGDDSCVLLPMQNNNLLNVFSIIKDDHGYYWFGGDQGLVRVKRSSNLDVEDYEIVHLLKTTDISYNAISQLKWIPGIYPVGDEIWMMTRNGHMMGIEYNFTYDDYLDDTFYSYKFLNNVNRAGGATAKFAFSDRDNVFVTLQGFGLQRIHLNRYFANTNIIEMLPIPPDGILAINHVNLDEVTGAVFGSSSELNDLVTYDVSNDGGVTWYPISLGERVTFPTSDYKLKLRFNLNRGSTPVVDFVKISYISYALQDDDQPDIRITRIKPIIRSIQPTEDRKMIINFDKINDPSLVGYVLQYGTVEGVFDKSVTLPKEAISYILENVDLDVRYYFRLRAFSNDVNSPWSDVLSAINTGEPEQEPIIYIPPVITITEDVSQEAEEEVEEEEEEKTSVVDRILERVNEEIEQGDNLLVSIGSITIYGAAGLLLLFSIPALQHIIIRGFVGLLSLLTFKKNRNEYGFVYDSVTKEPLSLAVVRIYDESKKLVETVVTGKYGYIAANLEEGIYTLDVRRSGFLFPSTVVKTSTDGTISNVYSGKLKVTEGATEILTAVPVDPVEENSLKKFSALLFNRGEFAFKAIQLLVFLFLFYLSYRIYLSNPSVLNAIVLGLYILLSVVPLVQVFVGKQRYGVVTDTFGTSLSNVKLQLIDAEFEKVVGERVTDEEGRYRFIVEPGNYKLRVIYGQREKDVDIPTLKGDPYVIVEEVVV